MNRFCSRPAILVIVLAVFVFTSNALARDSAILSHYNVTASPSRVFKLPAFLREISGIALSPDGRLFCHGDEEGTLYQVDPATGAVVKQFQLVEGKHNRKEQIKADFEDIAIVGERFFLVTSSGTLYEFREGGNKEDVTAVKYNTLLDSSYDVEGLCYDASKGELLLACKAASPKSRSGKNFREVYAFSLKTMSLSPVPRFLLDAATIAKAAGEKKEFNPSAILPYPESESVLMISSHAHLIAEISARDGRLLGVAKLPKKYHIQPEGLALLSDKTLLISDEGPEHGTINRYNFKK